MSDFYYPALDENTVKNFEIVLKLAVEHKTYFLESPYSGQIEEIVKRVAKAQTQAQNFIHREEATVPDSSSEDGEIEGEGRWEYLYRETQSLFKGLKNAKVTAGETAEQMAYFRTATSLMDKLISMQERALGLKEIHDFHMAVLEVMEAVLSPDQRTAVMDKLKAKIGK